jgi:8-amino-7-oxononanoate synthase
MGPDLQQLMEERYGLEKAGGRDVFKKAQVFWDIYKAVDEAGIYPYFQPLERNDGPTAVFQGQTVIMLGSNNYLGLTTDPRVRQAAMEAVREYGTSFTGSRLFNGSTVLHRRLEAKIAAFMGTEDCLVFTTGYQANLGVLTGLVNEHAVAVLDKGDHASIFDGARLCKGQTLRFQHNDPADLDRVLSGVDPNTGILVIVDGVYSMEGDIATLPEILAVCQKHGARLVVDDAHAIGVIGKGGRGTASHYELKGVDLTVGTFSKSLASIGGFVCGTSDVLKYVQHHGRPMVFSASLAPPNLAAASRALDILQEEPWRVDQLQQNADYMRRELRLLGFDVGHSQTPVIPIAVGVEPLTIMFWKCLLEEGIYTNPALHPAVPKDQGMLRTSYMATHEQEHLDKALNAFKNVGRMLGIIS